MNTSALGKVFLVGAGPGDPGLLTLRGLECLQQADLILYDKLASPRLLDFAPDRAERVAVEDLPGCHPERWPHIFQTLIDEARKGKCVVRLKGGDPSIFARGGEEAESLAAAGIPYEIVPGISSALAAAAYAEVPLTHRAHASAVAFITGHENPMKQGNPLDWSALARFPGTLVIYMGMNKLPLIQKRLLNEGMPADTPAAIVQAASTGQQRSVRTHLADLFACSQREGLMAPAVVIIGPVAALGPVPSWFERKPLFDCRVLICRPRDQADELIRQLELLGAVPYRLSTVEIRSLDDWADVDAVIDRLAEFDWLVFTSPNGVKGLLDRIWHRGLDSRGLGKARLAAIGPGTARTLESYRLRADVVPAVSTSEGLAGALRDRVAGQRVLLARANRGRDVLREVLGPVAHVEQVAVYQQVDAVEVDGDVLDKIGRGEINYALLTSSNIARGLLDRLDEIGRSRILQGVLRLVSISPVTSAAIRERGFPVAAEARTHTPEGTVQALMELYESEQAAELNADRGGHSS